MTAMRRWWWYAPFRWSGLLPSKGNDEWGRHTLVLPTIVAGTFVIATKNCDCDDMAEFRCITPQCPYIATTPGVRCLKCDPISDEDVAA